MCPITQESKVFHRSRVTLALVNVHANTMWPSRLCREERKPIQQLCFRLEAARFESPHCST
jgi:hypothetical protein